MPAVDRPLNQGRQSDSELESWFRVEPKALIFCFLSHPDTLVLEYYPVMKELLSVFTFVILFNSSFIFLFV